MNVAGNPLWIAARKYNMGKIIKRIVVLAGIFLAAVGVYFFTSLNTMEQSETVYTAMEEPTLPVVYTALFEQEAEGDGTAAGAGLVEKNRLIGYRQEMDITVARDSLTVLPEDRQLKVYFQGYGNSPLKIAYEIRSMNLERLVERTEVDDWTMVGDAAEVILPIQNLLTKGNEYLLHMTVDTEHHGSVHYYTRIVMQENHYGREMLAFARDFSERTLDPEQAKGLATYLETSPTADNSSLGHVTIESSFSQLTWAGLDVEQVGETEVTLQELDGLMGQAKVSYQVRRIAEDGQEELYDVDDHFTMKWGEKRIYLMDFERVTNQVFTGERELYSGRRILLGIGNDDVIQREKSNNGRYLGFVFNRDLWQYDQKENRAVKVFSFRSSKDASGRSDYDQHGIRILQVKDDGSVEFLVYGYMNRGFHEGQQGISLCSYSDDGTMTERFFVESSLSFAELRRDVEKLSYFSDKGMLYLYQDQAVYGIDLSSKEYMVVAEGLLEGCYAISGDRTRIAWQEGENPYESSVIHVFDMASGIKQEIKSGDGTVLRTLGFVQGDFVYGLARPADVWVMNGRTEELPMYALEIVDQDLNIQTRYEKGGYYLADIAVEEARIHMKRLVKMGDHAYTYHDADTIVCNEAVEEVYMEGIGWFASEIRRKVYFIQMDQELKGNKAVKVSVARKVSYDQSERLAFHTGTLADQMKFYAYGNGRLQGVYMDFADAVETVYESMGTVTDQHQRVLWNRVNRATARTIRDPKTAVSELAAGMEGLKAGKETEFGLMILDARGCALNRMLYFISEGVPVIGYGEEGCRLVIYGYDQYNITVLNMETGESYKMGLNDGAAYFEKYGNDFVCGVIMTE